MPWQSPPPHVPAPWSLAGPRPAEQPRPDRVLLIASLPRSGSTLLGRAIGATGQLGVPEEYFDPTIVANYRQAWGMPRLTLKGTAGVLRRRLRGEPGWWVSYRYSHPTMEAYRDIIVDRTMSSSGRFAVKMHWMAYASFHGSPWDPVTWGCPVDWIHLTRADVLRQAISFVRARQTKVWYADMPEQAAARYDRDEITSVVRRLQEWDEGWRGHFTSHGISPLEVSYETLAADYPAQVRVVLDSLGLPSTPVPEPPLARQSDDLTEAWLTRYLSDAGSTSGPSS